MPASGVNRLKLHKKESGKTVKSRIGAESKRGSSKGGTKGITKGK